MVEEVYEILKEQGNRTCQMIWGDDLEEASAIQNVKKQLIIVDPDLIIYFISPNYDLNKIYEEMSEEFNLSQTIGCHTNGKIESNLFFSKAVLDKLQFFLAFCFY